MVGIKRYTMEELKEIKRLRGKKYREKMGQKLKDKKKEYRMRNKEKIAARDKEYKENNREKVLAKKKEYREKNKKRILNIAKEYNKENKENIKIRKKKYYIKNKDKLKVKMKKYNEKNKEKIKVMVKKYQKEHKDEIKVKMKKHYEDNKKAICIICGEPANDKFCSTECRNIGLSGEKHYNWKGGPKPYDKNWNRRFKKIIRERDSNMCMICNRHRDEFNQALSVHHLDGNPQNTIEENCICLCRRHHSIVEGSGSKKYTFWMPRFRKLLTKLYGYKYGEKR